MGLLAKHCYIFVLQLAHRGLYTMLSVVSQIQRFGFQLE